MSTTYRQNLLLSTRLEKNRPFLELILEIADDLLVSKEPNSPFVLSELFEGYWERIGNNYLKCLAGMFISRMAAQHLLPIQVVGKRGNTLIYERRL